MRFVKRTIAVLLMFAAFLIPMVFKAFDTCCWRTMDDPKMLPWLWIFCGPLIGGCCVYSFLLMKSSMEPPHVPDL